MNPYGLETGIQSYASGGNPALRDRVSQVLRELVREGKVEQVQPGVFAKVR
jgi:hypothetical protein